MIDPLLLGSLVDFLDKVVDGYIVEDVCENKMPVTVIQGYLPPKRTAPDESYEKCMIQVRYSDGEADFNTAEDQSKSINRMIIAVRTTSDDVQIGPQNTVNLMAMIQRKIYEHPILNRKYRAIFPLKWKAPTSDTWPFWEGEMTIPYIVPMVQEIFDMGLGIGGDYRG